MRSQVSDRVAIVIEQFRLHDSYPVKMEALEEWFPVRYHDLTDAGVLGMALPPKGGWPASSSNKARIVIDSGVGESDARIIYAHEIGHGICEHIGFTSSEALDITGRHEREAWEVASALLIPEEAVREYQTVERIAAACEVPEWLVEIWPFIDV